MPGRTASYTLKVPVLHRHQPVLVNALCDRGTDAASIMCFRECMAGIWTQESRRIRATRSGTRHQTPKPFPRTRLTLSLLARNWPSSAYNAA